MVTQAELEARQRQRSQLRAVGRTPPEHAALGAALARWLAKQRREEALERVLAAHMLRSQQIRREQEAQRLDRMRAQLQLQLQQQQQQVRDEDWYEDDIWPQDEEEEEDDYAETSHEGPDAPALFENWRRWQEQQDWKNRELEQQLAERNLQEQRERQQQQEQQLAQRNLQEQQQREARLRYFRGCAYALQRTRDLAESGSLLPKLGIARLNEPGRMPKPRGPRVPRSRGHVDQACGTGARGAGTWTRTRTRTRR